MTVHNKLKDFRYDMRMTQKEFAQHLGISSPQYNRYERNNAQPTLETALKVSETLGCTVNDLFYLADKPIND